MEIDGAVTALDAIKLLVLFVALGFSFYMGRVYESAKIERDEEEW